MPRFELTEVGSLLGTLPVPIRSENVKPMEGRGQDYGFILYRTSLQGPIHGDPVLKELRDYAVVMLDVCKRVGLLDRQHNAQSLPLDVSAARCDARHPR